MLAMPGWLDCGTKIVNKALIMALNPHTPHIARLQERVLSYAESPCTTLEEMKEHSAFGEWRRHFDDPGMGLIADTKEYAAILDHGRLSGLRQGGAVLCGAARARLANFCLDARLLLPAGTAPGREGHLADWVPREAVLEVCARSFQGRPEGFRVHLRCVNIFKVSTLFATDWEKPMAWHLGNKTTKGRVLQHATDPATVMQATLAGT